MIVIPEQKGVALAPVSDFNFELPSARDSEFRENNRPLKALRNALWTLNGQSPACLPTRIDASKVHHHVDIARHNELSECR